MTELLREGSRPTAITSLWRSGRLIQLKAGLYQLPEALPSQHAAIVQACTAVPNGVVALVSALHYHGLTDANPEVVWVAVPLSGYAPKVSEPPVQYVRFRRGMYELGAESCCVDGHPVRVYSREKALCDCLRLPELVTRETALNALRRYLHGPGARVNDLLEMGRQCRATKWMRPYVEGLTA